ncbi:MAG: GAF and ANTAR domain-containing protein [Nocardioidaceae bacterium]|nr:GAF and ANTAR domain-containing protein [Nocardioidaceae bacterium]
MDERTDAANLFARVSKDLMREQEEGPTLHRVATRAVEVVPACQHAGISLRRPRRRVMSVASTSDLAETADQLQHELSEGPCLDAVWDDDSYLANDLEHDVRWPRWGPRVFTAGIGSVLSIRLATETETLGALNLYAEPVDAFTPEDVDLALIYASHAADAMNTAQLVSGLQVAVRSRHLIGLAQGLLMERYQLSVQQAFDVLRRYSNESNVRVHDLARIVVEERRLPELADLRPPEPVGPAGDDEAP